MNNHSFGIRNKLISIFVFIKVVPLVVLAWFAWSEIAKLVDNIQQHFQAAVEESRTVTKQVADLATEDSIRALDVKSREAIERLSTDTARQVAIFLKERDLDVLLAASLTTNVTSYKQFLGNRYRPLSVHGPMVMDKEGDKWIGRDTQKDSLDAIDEVTANNKDNEKDFHYRKPEVSQYSNKQPLYLEMSFVDLKGQEKIKVTTSEEVQSSLFNVSQKKNTYCRAETYFQHLEKLKPGEVYVSEVIGAYVKTHMIGPYTRKTANKKGVEFQPELSGYAGLENPVGKRFQGLIRWATPVMKNGEKIGYVTLALDHTHIMEFTDHILPTNKRYTEISDASSGNYAFMWDYKGRNISHPRDYFIVGYNPETGEPELPWLEKKDYQRWLESERLPSEFLQSLPTFKEQSLEKKPSLELMKRGLVALDCRYLNFAPQCSGWTNLTQQGGSGSFLIFWSGLWKLTTAATIPYYTGMYKDSPRGFGYVTIGANVHEFHKAAMDTAKNIEDIGAAHMQYLDNQNSRNQIILMKTLRKTAKDLSVYTGIMIIVVIIIAFWMASLLTGRITKIITSFNRFQKGDMAHRLHINSGDEVEDLASSFNEMADDIEKAITDNKTAREESQKTNILLQEEIVERQNAEQALAEHRDNLEELVSARTQELEQEIKDRKFVEESKEELEARLFRAEKMEALGTLAGGVAHDLNNILSGIATYPELLLMSIEESNSMYRPLQTIKKSGDKAAAIVQDLLTLARRGVAINDVVDLNSIISEYLESPEFSLMMDGSTVITLDVNLATDLFPLLGSRLHLFKTVMNLVNNAVESMANGGEVSIVTANCYMDTRLSLYDEVLEGEYITLTVSDTGEGISEADMERIFEPFFTKKKMGRSGTGLGMAVVWGTVQDHKGYIDCQSKVDSGTVFTIYFPVSRDELSVKEIVSDFPALAGNNEKILVVDDIAQQLEIASMILTKLNYAVHTVSSGEDALSFLEDNKVDLVILDMIMEPGMDGLDTYREILEMYPGQKAIIASGYSETDRIRKAMELGVELYLKKPYAINTLGQSVKAVLD